MTAVTVIRSIAAILFCAGLLDLFLGNRLGLGKALSNGAARMGSLLLGMTGIYSLSPLLAEFSRRAFAPVAALLGIDLAIFPCMFLAVDMGAFPISAQLAADPQIAHFAGVLISSTLGAAISFSFPVAAGMVQPEDNDILLYGFVLGILTLLPGCFVGGLVQGLDAAVLLRCLLPMLALTGILCALLFFRKKALIAVLKAFNKLTVLVGYVGLAAQAVQALTGLQLIPGMLPLSEGALLITRIILFLCGVYPLLHIVRSLLRRQFGVLEARTGLDKSSLLCVIGNLVSNVMSFDLMREMNPRGKLLCAILAFGPAFMIGGQMGYVSSVAPEMAGAFLAAKLTAGVVGVVLFVFMAGRLVGEGERAEKPGEA